MRITLEKSDKDYLFIGIIVLLICCSIFFQVRTSGVYEKQLVERELVNKGQRDAIKTLKGSVKDLDNQAIKLGNKADSLQLSENKYKNNYYELNKKFKSSVSLYNRSSSDDKWRVFTEIINE